MEGFIVAGWMSFDIDDSHIDLEALEAFDDANRDRVVQVVEAAMQRQGVMQFTGALTFANAMPFLHVARLHPERSTDYLDRLKAFVADVEREGVTVWGVLSARSPDDPPGAFRTITLGQTRLV